MPLRIKCPAGHVLMVPSSRGGTSVRCPHCNQAVQVPVVKTADDTAAASSAEAVDDKPAVNSEQPAAESAAQDPAPAVAKPAAKTPPRPPKREVKNSAGDTPASGDEQQRPVEVGQTEPTTRSDTASLPPRPSDESVKPPRLTPVARDAVAAAKPVQQPERPAIPPSTRPKTSPTSSTPLAKPRPPLAKTSAAPRPPAPAPADDKPQPPPARGFEHDRAKLFTAYYLATGLAAAGLFGMGPAVYQIMTGWQSDPPQPVPRWVYGALLVGFIQLAYAVYLMQLPDWGTVWVVSVFTLCLASVYAGLLSAVALSQDDGTVLAMLQLSGPLRRNATLWCFSMLGISSLLAYLCGREGLNWHRVFVRLTAATEKD